MNTKQLFSWRHAIQAAKLSSTTKLVLYNLSIHMNDAGKSCFPSTKTQAEDTGLSERAICTHLKRASDYGLIKVSKHGFSGQRWARNEYKATFSEYNIGTEPNDGEPDIGTEPNDTMALKEGQTNYPLNYPIKKYTKKKSKTKNKKLTISEWEDNHGELTYSMIDNWVNNKSFDPDKIKILLENFRIRMTANGNEYADFVAAFQTWVNNGYLGKKPEELKIFNPEKDLKTKTSDFGVRL